jgi:hypothetical protein
MALLSQQGLAEVRLVWPVGKGARKRINWLTVRAKKAYVPQQVRAVFGARPHDSGTVPRGDWPVSQVADVGIQIAPLCGQQVNQVQPLRLPF